MSSARERERERCWRIHAKLRQNHSIERVVLHPALLLRLSYPQQQRFCNLIKSKKSNLNTNRDFAQTNQKAIYLEMMKKPTSAQVQYPLPLACGHLI